ncbi:hypothetical protein SRHO_G00187910 [Serrasalmus rhombeus]
MQRSAVQQTSFLHLSPQHDRWPLTKRTTLHGPSTVPAASLGNTADAVSGNPISTTGSDKQIEKKISKPVEQELIRPHWECWSLRNRHAAYCSLPHTPGLHAFKR